MSHEILVLANGESFTATDMVFSEWTRHQETYPGNREDGSEGQVELIVGIAEVHFTATPGRMVEGIPASCPLATDSMGSRSSMWRKPRTARSSSPPARGRGSS